MKPGTVASITTWQPACLSAPICGPTFGLLVTYDCLAVTGPRIFSMPARASRPKSSSWPRKQTFLPAMVVLTWVARILPSVV